MTAEGVAADGVAAGGATAGLEGSETIPFGASPLERWGERRRDTAFLDEARTNPDARLLVISDSRVPVDAAGDLAWRPLASDAGASDAGISDGGVSDGGASEGGASGVGGGGAGGGEGSGDGEGLRYLGEDAEGRPLFARDAGEGEEPPGLVALREVGAGLSPHDAAAALQAIGLSAWHRRARYCPACGGETRVADAGHRRRCVSCGAGHFPRTDSAVIMLVTDGDRCVLGQRVGAPTNRWSTLAGFVETGESLESAVAREVREEVGLVVTATHYRGSQPWPFPASLMVAFDAEADYAPLSINYEHQDVRWFTRDEVAEGLANGAIAVPPPISAGGFLIRSWVARR